MLLEQILRNQAKLQADFLRKSSKRVARAVAKKVDTAVTEIKAAAETAIKDKLTTIGVQVPLEIHQRMTTFLERTKGKPGFPKTLKELALACIKASLDKFEVTGFPAVYAPDAADTPRKPAKSKPFVEELPGEADDAVGGLTALVRSFAGAESFTVRHAGNALEVVVLSTTLIAPGTIPATYSGHLVKLRYEGPSTGQLKAAPSTKALGDA